MVTTENGVRMTDMELRHAVEDIMERRGWTTNRVAAEIRSSEDKLVNWLEHSHVTAMTQFRANLLEFVREWRAAPAAQAEPIAEGAKEPFSIDQYEPDGLVAETSPGLWSLPAGFVPIAPASQSTLSRPPGITISAKFDRVGITSALVAALGNPARVLVACNPLTKALVVGPERDGYPALKVTKHRDLSKSVGDRAKALGVEPGFYPAEDAGDGTWRIELAA